MPPVIKGLKRGKIAPGENVQPWVQSFLASSARTAYFFHPKNHFRVDLLLGGYLALCSAAFNGLVAIGIANDDQKKSLIGYMWFGICAAGAVRLEGSNDVAGYFFVIICSITRFSFLGGIKDAIRLRDGRTFCNFKMVLFNFINFCLWTYYGLLLNNFFLILNAGLGVLCSAIPLIIKLLLHPKLFGNKALYYDQFGKKIKKIKKKKNDQNDHSNSNLTDEISSEDDIDAPSSITISQPNPDLILDIDHIEDVISQLISYEQPDSYFFPQIESYEDSNHDSDDDEYNIENVINHHMTPMPSLRRHISLDRNPPLSENQYQNQTQCENQYELYDNIVRGGEDRNLIEGLEDGHKMGRVQDNQDTITDVSEIGTELSCYGKLLAYQMKEDKTSPPSITSSYKQSQPAHMTPMSSDFFSSPYEKDAQMRQQHSKPPTPTPKPRETEQEALARYARLASQMSMDGNSQEYLLSKQPAHMTSMSSDFFSSPYEKDAQMRQQHSKPPTPTPKPRETEQEALARYARLASQMSMDGNSQEPLLSKNTSYPRLSSSFYFPED
mmetsp:Transcript_4532/g.5797  ORF Transcript_4532/g.5797 Transcript_4532/m.5797 type:complete len:554 (-) Transcript_4532:257-1918(-)